MSESEEQKKVCKYLDTLNKLYFAIPNHPGKRPPGMKKGVPDLFLAQKVGKYGGLFIEMKQENGKPSPEQIKWRDELLKCDYKSVICYGAEQAINAINNYLLGKECLI